MREVLRVVVERLALEASLSNDPWHDYERAKRRLRDLTVDDEEYAAAVRAYVVAAGI